MSANFYYKVFYIETQIKKKHVLLKTRNGKYIKIVKIFCFSSMFSVLFSCEILSYTIQPEKFATLAFKLENSLLYHLSWKLLKSTINAGKNYPVGPSMKIL